MGIRFIFGRAGTGKSRFCLEQIKKKIDRNDNNNKLILLVPEQYTFDTEKKFLEIVTEKGFLRGEVLSFKRMAHRVFEECGGRTDIRISDSGRNMLIYKILKDKTDELEYFNRMTKEQGFSSVVSKLITEFKKYNISTEILNLKEEEINDDELKKKLKDLGLIYNEFNNALHKQFIDGDDELTLLYNKLMDCNIYDDAEIWIDEFTTFTPQQLEVIKILAKRAKTVNITLCSDSLSNGVDIDYTDVFDAIKNTENSILNIMKEGNISYLEPINLNKGTPYRFLKNDTLSHLEKHFFTYPFKSYKEEPNNIRLYKANNSYEEVETVAKDILEMVRDKGYRFKDIAVVCRNIAEYEKIATVIFNDYNIPFFIDKKREILDNPLVVLIISSLEILINNWSYESVFKFLKSGLINIEGKYIDVLENYVLANGIKGYKWTRDLYDKDEISDEENILFEIMEEVREPLISLHNKIRGKKTVKEITTSLYNFLVELKV
ncbi:MAG: exodeoxyribonuclease V subunit gamma, partial [Clostridium sp.]|nr:exodeoxyribonuclease V subunit gamma [Clostridium sp.]